MPLIPEAPKIVLAAPGSVSPGQRLTKLLAAGSLLAAGFRLPPLAPASTFTVTNLNPGGAGSLRAALSSANSHPGADVINFQAGLAGTIAITSELTINDSVQIIGPGPGVLAVSGSHATRVFYLYSSALITATLSGLTIRDGKVSADGAGILDEGVALILDHVHVVSNTVTSGNGGGVDVLPSTANQASLTVRDSLISGNSAQSGAGLAVFSAAHGLTIQRTQVLSNTGNLSGAGIYLYAVPGNTLIEDTLIAGNQGVYGGGLFLYKSAGPVTIRRSTISGNYANFSGGLGLYVVANPVVIDDSTIAGNKASITGGGIYIARTSGRPITLQNSTVVSNSAATSMGGLGSGPGYDLVLPITNTIIARNTAPEAPDIRGAFDLRYDLVQITGTELITDGGGNLFGLDPLLGPLGDNGGPTPTLLPAAGSPVVNAGDPGFAGPATLDERGRPRVVGGRVDMGAVEYSAGMLQFSAANFQVAENVITATVTVTRAGGSDGAASVHYATGGGSATPGSDYQAAAGTLTWATGDGAAKTFTVTILNDSQPEGNETIGLTLSNATGAALGAPSTATLTIQDDDGKLFLPVVER
jgi:hypothetical protein